MNVGECGLDMSVSGYGQMTGFSEYYNERPCSVRHWDFLEQMNNC
jgi:hypothetical protein